MLASSSGKMKATPPGVPTARRLARSAAYENSRHELRVHVPPAARRVLDLGCASGAVGEALKAAIGCEVVGIEGDPIYAERARTRLDAVVEGDLEGLATSLPELGEFDVLIAGDVLEHLRDPWSVLSGFARLLSSGGTALISVPNVRYWETLWQVGVRGTWPRRNEGIFDRDHLRWFTAVDAIELAKEAGLEPTAVHRQYRFSPRGTRFDRHAARFERTPLRPFLAFQILVVARKP